MVVPTVRTHQRDHAGPAGRVPDVSRKPPPAPGPPAPAAATAAQFLAGQEITTTDCRQCGAEVSGLKGRYACGLCGWTNPWHEGHGDLPAPGPGPEA